MRANFAIRVIYAHNDDLELQQRYIDGDITLAQMLARAHDFAHQVEKPDSPF